MCLVYVLHTHTVSYSMDGGNSSPRAEEATLLAFPHTEGAEYCAGLYPHFKLENGTQVHCYYKRNFHRAPFAKIKTPFHPPSRLHEAGLVAPPPPPLPLQMKTEDSMKEFLITPCIVHGSWKKPSGMSIESKRNFSLYSISPASQQGLARVDFVFADLETLHGVSSSKCQKYTTMPTDAFVQYATQVSYPEESTGIKVLESEKDKINRATTDVVIPIKFEFGEAEEDDDAEDDESDDNRVGVFLARYKFSESKDLYNKKEVCLHFCQCSHEIVLTPRKL